MRKGAARGIEHQITLAEGEITVVRSLSELAGPFLFSVILRKQGWWSRPHGFCTVSLQSQH